VNPGFPIEILPREPQVELELDIVPVRVGIAGTGTEGLLLLPLPDRFLHVIRNEAGRVQMLCLKNYWRLRSHSHRGYLLAPRKADCHYRNGKHQDGSDNPDRNVPLTSEEEEHDCIECNED